MPHYVQHSEYTRDQHQLQKSIEVELHQTERSLNTARDEIRAFEERATVRLDSHDVHFKNIERRLDAHDVQFEKIDRRFDAHDVQFEKIDQRFNSLEGRLTTVESVLIETRADVQRILAQSQNGKIRNPLLPIHPVITFDPTKGILKPLTTLFPRNANEFYALRDPKTDQQRRMLEYLISFYDLTHTLLLQTDLDTSATDQDEPTSSTDLVIECLEAILGLNENNIDEFRQKAREYSRQGSMASKRSVPTTTNDEPRTRKTKLDLRPRASTSAFDRVRPVTLPVPEEEEKEQTPEMNLSDQSAKLGWDTRSTPSSKKQMNNDIKKYMEEQRLEKAARRKTGTETLDEPASRRGYEKEKEKSSSSEDEPSAYSGTTTNPNTPR
ncbi:hypothetical protein FSARC_14429 [Fusarium sarcochroum]|uniref:Uncharacterized protein n=1 Tax=Fusarium sarcochroum TaxID=1208366 RepID=A0A8H4STE4_9HYPO|nr:hypothetical protein FSARC_14429 [Fusarium sarcochroum]